VGRRRAGRGRMGVLDRIRQLGHEQQRALRAIDREERGAREREARARAPPAAEEAYLRRRDRILGRDVPATYLEIEAARAALDQAARERQSRFERRRMAILAGHVPGASGPSQLDLLPP
jgi:hypothetical protein